MNKARTATQRGYVLVPLTIVLVFVAVVAAMQVLILTSVAATSRAFDSHRQTLTERVRLESVVTETVYRMRQISVAAPVFSLSDELTAQLDRLSPGGSDIVIDAVPAALPALAVFPEMTGDADPLAAVGPDLEPFLTPELRHLAGARVAAYPSVDFHFGSRRQVLDATRTYRSRIRVRQLAVPLTRFPVAAYELPPDVGSTDSRAGNGQLGSTLPAGLAPGRDPAFVALLQGQTGMLPYHYRHRAALAAAYRYLFSNAYVARVAEYAGITHFQQLDVSSGTARLAGLTLSGTTAQWDLALAGDGTYGGTTLSRDAAVVFVEAPGYRLRMAESVPAGGMPPLVLVVLGPADPSVGPLTVELESITRPVLIVGFNVRLGAAPSTTSNAAIFLDPASSLAPGTRLVAGHLSYWAGMAVADASVSTRPLPAGVEALAPRVMYVGTQSEQW